MIVEVLPRKSENISKQPYSHRIQLSHLEVKGLRKAKFFGKLRNADFIFIQILQVLLPS